MQRPVNVMNTWASYAAGSLAGIVLHSVPPLVVFVAAEAVTDLRDKLTEAVTAAATEAASPVGSGQWPAIMARRMAAGQCATRFSRRTPGSSVWGGGTVEDTSVTANTSPAIRCSSSVGFPPPGP